MITVFATLALAIGTAQDHFKSPPPTPVDHAEDRADGQTGDPSDEIVVQAPPTPLERKRELRRMVSTILREPRSGRTIGTFFDPVCPKVFGLPAKVAAAIETRIRANAKALGASRSDPSRNCRHNLSVTFVSPADGSARTWLDAESEHLRHLKSFERARVVNEDGPVRAWTYDLLRSADGLILADGTGERTTANRFQNRNLLNMASRLTSPITVEVAGAVVMIELMAADGKTIEQLADYATMRGLANLGGVDRDTVPAAPTVLTLFQDEAEDAPAELTTFDRAFLSKLYDASRNTNEQGYYAKIAARAARMEREADETPVAQPKADAIPPQQ